MDCDKYFAVESGTAETTLSFSGRKVLDNLSFEVNKGEVFALLGHNGAGKSTTINLILGLKYPDEGSATILGMDAAKHRKKVFERVGVQLQHTEYHNMMTVEEACMEYASLYKKPSDYKALLHSFGLSDLKKSYINKLSGGEKQKLSVVLALIGNPDIVFLDELTTGLDVAARREVWRTLKHLKEKGLTIFLTTHYMEAADSGLTFLQSAFVSLSTVGICCTAFMSIPITIVELRNQGILRRMYCSPCSPVRLLTCDILSGSMIAIVSTIILTIAAILFGYRMSGNVVAFIGVWLLTMVSMFSIGLLVASLCRTTKSMNVATSILYFPMLLFSGATIPAEVFPAGVRAVIKWLLYTRYQH